MKKQLRLKELLVKIAEEHCERLPNESEEDYLQRCGNWNFGKGAQLRYDQSNGTFRRPNVVKESEEIIKCQRCGHEWKVSDGGDDKYICHICGYNNKPITDAVDHSNDRDMVVGVAEIIRMVKDMGNRKDIMVSMMAKFRNENVTFDKEEFQKMCGFNNKTITESVNQSKVRNQYDKVIDGIKKATKSLNDDEVYELHEMLKKFFNKGI